ncbi:hypothetical protein TCA2_4568 [Paenibacillus sp. TCA20]|uniref:hypothetical protein n=1 Tax=Paenibacillus sp. TCA20 TaxID=1499968 RepID=UPI0004D608A2|nr:hypothetical protein [Paenibacillus sp. TCA20]GAK42076.1 hypothetical protein TCA2_4568 [Paenibacillus sp. TCA20]
MTELMSRYQELNAREKPETSSRGKRNMAGIIVSEGFAEHMRVTSGDHELTPVRISVDGTVAPADEETFLASRAIPSRGRGYNFPQEILGTFFDGLRTNIRTDDLPYYPGVNPIEFADEEVPEDAYTRQESFDDYAVSIYAGGVPIPGVLRYEMTEQFENRRIEGYLELQRFGGDSILYQVAREQESRIRTMMIRMIRDSGEVITQDVTNVHWIRRTISRSAGEDMETERFYFTANSIRSYGSEN